MILVVEAPLLRRLLVQKCMLVILYFDFQVICPLYDEVVYLNEHHKRKLREEFGKDN